MRKIVDVLRLTASGLSSRKVAASLSIGATTVIDCLQRARAAGVAWPLPAEITDEILEARLYPVATAMAAMSTRRPKPDWAAVHRELKRSGVTLQLLWEEHRGAHPDGYGYSRYCELYRAWEARLSPTMRQTHIAGERMFVDYAGTTLDVIDASTGELKIAQLFVAVLGASNYTYAEATWTQALSDWIGSHTRSFAFFAGSPTMVVSDNLRSGITKACFYEPAVNRTYAEMAAHYNTAIVPARPYRHPPCSRCYRQADRCRVAASSSFVSPAGNGISRPETKAPKSPPKADCFRRRDQGASTNPRQFAANSQAAGKSPQSSDLVADVAML